MRGANLSDNEPRVYDVIIVGAGPGGLFTAYELLSRKSDLKVLIVDKGKDIPERKCPPNTEDCSSCNICDALHGLGGVGFYIDCKLCLAYVGTILEMSSDEMSEKIAYVDDVIVGFLRQINMEVPKHGEEISSRKLGRMECHYYPVRSLGSDVARMMAARFKEHLTENNVTTKLKHRVISFARSGDGFVCDVLSEKGSVEKYESRYLVVCPGRSGASWLRDMGTLHGLDFRNNHLDLGIRIEFDSDVGQKMFAMSANPKFKLFVNDVQVKTHCFCHKGYVFFYRDPNLFVDGYSDRNYSGENSNVNLLYRLSFPDHVDILAYKENIVRTINLCGKGYPIIQRLGDLRAFRPSTVDSIKENPIRPSLKFHTPHDIGLVYPRTVCRAILQFIDELDRHFPGIGSDDTLLYVPTAEWGVRTVVTNMALETNVENLYVGGDGAGLTQGSIAAGISGVVIGRDILHKEGA